LLFSCLSVPVDTVSPSCCRGYHCLVNHSLNCSSRLIPRSSIYPFVAYLATARRRAKPTSTPAHYYLNHSLTMKFCVALAFAASALATPMPQAGAPSGCVATSDQKFNIRTVDQTPSKRDLQRRQLDGTLTISLNNGILKDQAGRQGYIASNYQYVDRLLDFQRTHH
jgi:hypothetical protein